MLKIFFLLTRIYKARKQKFFLNGYEKAVVKALLIDFWCLEIKQGKHGRKNVH